MSSKTSPKLQTPPPSRGRFMDFIPTKRFVSGEIIRATREEVIAVKFNAPKTPPSPAPITPRHSVTTLNSVVTAPSRSVTAPSRPVTTRKPIPTAQKLATTAKSPTVTAQKSVPKPPKLPSPVKTPAPAPSKSDPTPFINTEKLEKRPLSPFGRPKNHYQRPAPSSKPAKSFDTKLVPVQKSSGFPLAVAIILTITLGAGVGFVIYLAFFQ